MLIKTNVMEMNADMKGMRGTRARPRILAPLLTRGCRSLVCGGYYSGESERE